MRRNQRRVAKGVRFLSTLTLAFCLILGVGCATKRLGVHESVSAPKMCDDVVRYAITLLGKPYRNAGKGPDAFDCSGFVYHVYGRFHIALPVSTEGLNKIGYEVSRGDIRAGDLVVFKITGEYHVGVIINYLEFIHASKSRGVAIDSLDFGYWKKNFSHFRRIL